MVDQRVQERRAWEDAVRTFRRAAAHLAAPLPPSTLALVGDHAPVAFGADLSLLATSPFATLQAEVPAAAADSSPEGVARGQSASAEFRRPPPQPARSAQPPARPESARSGADASLPITRTAAAGHDTAPPVFSLRRGPRSSLAHQTSQTRPETLRPRSEPASSPPEREADMARSADAPATDARSIAHSPDDPRTVRTLRDEWPTTPSVPAPETGSPFASFEAIAQPDRPAPANPEHVGSEPSGAFSDPLWEGALGVKPGPIGRPTSPSPPAASALALIDTLADQLLSPPAPSPITPAAPTAATTGVPEAHTAGDTAFPLESPALALSTSHSPVPPVSGAPDDGFAAGWPPAGVPANSPAKDWPLDAETLAAMVNDALVEQARRHGVDLS